MARDHDNKQKDFIYLEMKQSWFYEDVKMLRWILDEEILSMVFTSIFFQLNVKVNLKNVNIYKGTLSNGPFIFNDVCIFKGRYEKFFIMISEETNN